MSGWSQEVNNIIQTTIVIPAYREEKGLPIVLTNVLKVIDDSYEIIVVDDGSGDDTPKVAERFPCRLIKHEVNKGKGEALKTGFDSAAGENIIWIDSDNSYPAEYIPRMVEAFNDYDVVVCSRKYGREHIPPFNRIGNFIFSFLIRNIYGYIPEDPCSGLYGAKKKHLEAMKLNERRFSIEPEISMKAGRMKLRMLDIPIAYQVRVGNTKLNAVKVGFEDMWAIVKLLFWFPS